VVLQGLCARDTSAISTLKRAEPDRVRYEISRFTLAPCTHLY
jgi:hypothetical protein